MLRLQNAAWNAMEWFEVCGERYCDQLEPEQFMYSMLTRSQRISHENLRLRDKVWLEGYERWFAERTPLDRDPGQLRHAGHQLLVAAAGQAGAPHEVGEGQRVGCLGDQVDRRHRLFHDGDTATGRGGWFRRGHAGAG